MAPTSSPSTPSPNHVAKLSANSAAYRQHDEQSGAKKAAWVVSPNGQVKREKAVEAARGEGAAAGAGEEEEKRIDLAVLLRGGALGVQQLPWRRPGKQCHACGGAAKILCPNDLFGCWSYVAYYDVAGHQRACPHAPCSCSEPRCDFLGSPPMLLAHLVADMWLVSIWSGVKWTGKPHYLNCFFIPMIVEIAAALNTILGRWGKKASPEWNISGELCSGFAADKTDWDNYRDINPFIKCDCTFNNNTLCHITRLNLFRNYLTGPIPSFIGKFTSMQYLSLSFNPLSGLLPKELGNLTNLLSLGISSDNFTGSLPEELGNLTKLQQLYFDSSGFSGPFPSSFSKLQNLKILSASDNVFKGKIPAYLGTMTNLEDMFLGNNSLTGKLPDGIWWQTTSYSIPPVKDYSFAVDCGSNASIRGSDDTIYEADPTNLGAATYYVTGQTRWGVSSVGNAIDAKNIIYSSQPFQNVVDSELFETARMSSSSLRYYGLGLENGNYTVLLQFAELAFPDSQTWLSLGRRVFDIYIQGALKQKDFDIRKTAGGKSFSVVNRSFMVTVSKNFLEIHLFWAGKGTVDIPTKDNYYGPMISALSVTPNFTPTVRNGIPKRKSKAGAISGILIGAIVLVLAALFGVFTLVKKRRALAQQKEELYNLVGRPDVFSYAELKLATDNFSSQNILGEGGFGPVYKGKLPDERVIAVKQLSQSSHQGTSQFVTEVATISAVQHRNLVILHGCCIDSKTPLLVYEYLENGSLDRAIFGDSNLNLDWVMRFEIILGIARGLTYLHEESSVRIVHRDIKASNVLLDTNLIPKISDFGLAKLYDENQTHVSTRIAGTLGYLAPEYAMRGHLSEKADIFAFGVVMLETVAGRPNTDNSLEESKICLLEWAWGLYEMDQALGIVDPSLKEFDKDEAFRVIYVALVCTQGSPHQRPPMSKVVTMLTGDVDVAKVVTKPSYITEWQLRGGGYSSNTTSSYAWSSNPELSRQKEITEVSLQVR
uniref:non-specific serine/threonine protein kinase n=1 Tax=Oryza nivara TaxID=4536 RepID=A0A0E0IHI4_ORYNI